MSGFGTGHAELIGAAKDIVSTNESVQGVLSNVRNTVDALSGAWAGSAAVAFGNLMERFTADADKLQKALLDIAEQMSGTAATYLEQEEEHSQSMSSIMGRLGGGA